MNVFSYKNFNEKCAFMEKKMGQTILCFAILFLYTVLGAATAIEPLADPSGCNRKCGDIVVPFPFGFGNSSECFKDSSYQLVCNGTTLLTGNIPFVNFSLEEGTAVVDLRIAFNCRGGSENMFSSRVRFRRTSFTFSSTANMFTAIGCNTVAQISDGGKETGKFVSGCLSMCKRGTRIISLAALVKQKRISCSGIRCCQTPIPKGLKTLNISLDPYDDSDQSDNNTCSYGFLSGANFTLKMSPERVVRSPVVLDWAVGKMTCEEAKRNGTEYICGSNTNCINSTNGYGFGYRCLCNKGFEGNAYTRNGCTDINECLYRDGDPYPCKGNCKNMVGNYTCSCSFGYEGNGKIGCSMKAVTKALLVITALFVLVTSILVSLWLYKKKILRSNQQRNGGEFMDKLSVKCYKRSQLEKATNNFDSRRMLGEGANGWVYRGSLENMVEIAVKKSKLVDQDQIEQFLNEADIVSKINHKNVVKLLGLCLDSKVPMLVYEFVPNGTLFQHLHQNKSRWLDSWRNCLRVAAETARALDYMHSQADPLILHRDVKTSNILLDGKNTAKVADFGASKLIRMDRTIAPTQGQGTMGYLDPEYLQTGDLTTMSDVYAFGVVLMELLSKRKPISLGESGEVVALVKVFTSSIANNQFDKMLRVAEVTEQETEQVHLVARLAVRCVAMPSMNRPSMTEVADMLNGLSKEYSSYQLEGSGEETVNLLADQDSMTMSLPFDIEYSGNV